MIHCGDSGQNTSWLICTFLRVEFSALSVQNVQGYHIAYLRKNLPIYFCSMLVKYEPISIKSGTHVLEETLNETMQKGPTSLTVCARITLGNLR